MQRSILIITWVLLPIWLCAQTIIDNVEVKSGEVEDYVGSTLQTGSSVIIRDGGDSIFWADTKIILKPGFEAEAGSLFWASIDTDGDLLNDVSEALEGTNPNNPDTDGDGFLDGWEILVGLNPNSDDGDPSSWTDNDSDTMPDWWEDYFTAKSALNSFWEDYDGDGMINYVEFWAGSDPGPRTGSINFDSFDMWSASDHLTDLFPAAGDVLLLLPEKGVYSIDETNTNSALSSVTTSL